MIIAANNYHKLSDHKYLETRLIQWEHSPHRQLQLTSERYYVGDHDILRKKRMVIGENGKLVEVQNLPNNRNVDNRFAKMLDQKKNYLLGRPITFKCDDDEYLKKLQTVFNKRFDKLMLKLGTNAMKHGITWLHPYVNDNKLKFKCFPGYEVLPFWVDSEHTELVCAVRLYLEEKPDASSPFDVTKKVELYKADGVEYYTFDNDRLEPDVTKPKKSYLTIKTGDVEEAYNWERIPLIPFRFNAEEIPLLKRIKNLQDGYNEIISKFKDNMDEDSRNTIIVLENYDGEDLAEFRQKLAQYSAIKVRTQASGASGNVRTLNIEVNADNYESILKLFKEAIIDNARGYDFSELKSGSPNQMNLKSILSEIDMDANETETEFQGSLEELLWFVNNFLGYGKEEKQVDIIFNRDGIVNETEVIASMVSMGVEVSNKTKLSQLPFIDDPEEEQKRVDKEKEENMDAYGGAFPMEEAAASPNAKTPENPAKNVKNNE